MFWPRCAGISMLSDDTWANFGQEIGKGYLACSHFYGIYNISKTCEIYFNVNNSKIMVVAMYLNNGSKPCFIFENFKYCVCVPLWCYV